MKLAPGCSAVAWSVPVERILPTLPPPSVISLPTGKAETLSLSAALHKAEVSSGIYAGSEKFKAKGPGAYCSSAGMQLPCQRQVPALGQRREAQPLGETARGQAKCTTGSDGSHRWGQDLIVLGVISGVLESSLQKPSSPQPPRG